jgi:hypothetical protein
MASSNSGDTAFGLLLGISNLSTDKSFTKVSHVKGIDAFVVGEAI